MARSKSRRSCAVHVLIKYLRTVGRGEEFPLWTKRSQRWWRLTYSKLLGKHCVNKCHTSIEVPLDTYKQESGNFQLCRNVQGIMRKLSNTDNMLNHRLIHYIVPCATLMSGMKSKSCNLNSRKTELVTKNNDGWMITFSSLISPNLKSPLTAYAGDSSQYT